MRRTAGPSRPFVATLCPGEEMFDAAEHFRRRTPRKRQQQHAARIDASGDECRHAMGQRRGFAGPRAGDDQQGAASMAGRRPLFGIEIGEEGVDGCGRLHPCWFQVSRGR